MNCTNHNSELPPFKARCERMGIHIPTRNPAPAEIIAYLEKRMAGHQNHFAKNMDPSSGFHLEWKSVNDDLIDFLKQLRPAAGISLVAPPSVPHPSSHPAAQWPQPAPKNQSPSSSPNQTHSRQDDLPPKKSPPSDSTVANQQPTGESKVNPSDSNVNPSASTAKTNDFKMTPGASQNTSDASTSKKPAATSPSTASQTKSPTPPAEKPFDIREHLDAASLRVCYDLQEYLSGRSPLDALTPQQQNAIILLLEDYSAERVASVLAQPEPYGFNLKTSDSAVIRFKKRLARAEKKYIASLDDIALQQIMANAHQSEEAFQTAVQRLIKIRLLNAANNPLASADTLDALITSLNKLRKQTLAERKQTHAEKSK